MSIIPRVPPSWSSARKGEGEDWSVQEHPVHRTTDGRRAPGRTSHHGGKPISSTEHGKANAILEEIGRQAAFFDGIDGPFRILSCDRLRTPTSKPHFAEFVRSVYSADVKIAQVTLVGDIVDAVVDYARSASADLVIVAEQATVARAILAAGMCTTRSRSAPLNPVSVRSSLARRAAPARRRLF